MYRIHHGNVHKTDCRHQSRNQILHKIALLLLPLSIVVTLNSLLRVRSTHVEERHASWWWSVGAPPPLHVLMNYLQLFFFDYLWDSTIREWIKECWKFYNKNKICNFLIIILIIILSYQTYFLKIILILRGRILVNGLPGNNCKIVGLHWVDRLTKTNELVSAAMRPPQRQRATPPRKMHWVLWRTAITRRLPAPSLWASVGTCDTSSTPN